MDNKDVRSVLEDLIETCKDGQKGYQDAATHVKRGDLKSYFNQQSLERARFAEELRQELTRLGEPDKSRSLVGRQFGVAGGEDDRKTRPLGGDPARELCPGHSRHGVVGDQQINRFGPGEPAA